MPTSQFEKKALVSTSDRHFEIYSHNFLFVTKKPSLILGKPQALEKVLITIKFFFFIEFLISVLEPK